MKAYVKKIERLVSLNRLESAIDNLLSTIGDYEPIDDLARSASRDLRNYVISLSQRLHEAEDNRKKGVTTEADLSRERRTISNLLLDLVADLSKYPDFVRYLNDLEEEEAWKRATTLNTIPAYEEYFSAYPNGKYREQTKALIAELEEIERAKALEIKKKAEEEKRRRLQQGGAAEIPGTPSYASGFAAGSTQAAPPEPQTRPQNQYQTQHFSGSGRTAPHAEGAEFENLYAIIIYVATLFIPLVGLGFGAYIHLAKVDGRPKFNKASRSRGTIMFVIGVIMFFVYLGQMGGY
ncbi:MAG: hypothetical protein D6765_04865 [Bacteroidetes bacterium]|nr:MAG: hypothetical protein D6765_04865 [Bacteroidota bacterium]